MNLNNAETVCYVGGCGRLGLSLAAWTALQGFNVICADVDERAVEMLNAGESPITETGVQKLVKKFYGDRLTATTDTVEAVSRSKLSFVIVPTPSLEDGSFSIEYVLEACEKIGEGLRNRVDYHTVVIVSTVMPGDTGGPIRAALEQSSGKRAGQDFGLVYSPEFVRQGSIIRDFANPDQILLGQLDTKSGDAAGLYYARVITTLVRQHRMSLVSAEIAKLALNATVTTKLALANQIAWLCQAIEGADAADVLKAVGSDSRIGKKYFGVGTPDGGPCFPRDNEALIAAGRKAGVSLLVTEAVIAFRAAQYELILNLILELKPADGETAILGLTYKPGVDIVERSAGSLLCQKLEHDGIDVIAHDPALSTESLESCVRRSDLLVITTPWPEFLALQKMDLSGKTVLDLWGLLDESKLNCEKYVRLGKGNRG